MSADLLAAVVASARKSAAERERAGRRPEPSAARRGAEAFRAALSLAPGLRVIAECKRRSPSRGVLRRAYDAADIARQYAAAGASAISVLTEPTFFDGSLDDLCAVRAAVDLPLLRKDFIVSPFQLEEGRAAGADAALLIVAALQDAELRRLLAAARALDLAAVVEVHDAAELDRALAAGAEIVGVNSRNLRTLEVTLDVLDRLASSIPRGVLAIAESGLKAAADVRRLRAARYDAFLIGERFMADPSPGDALARLIADVDGRPM